MKTHPDLKIISLTLILAFTLCLISCGEDSGELVGFVWIEPGTFLMGSPDGSGGINGTVAEPGREDNETLHQVTLTKGFYMSKYEITQEQFFAVMGYNIEDKFTPGDRHPAEGLNWYEAIAFCNRLSIQEGLVPVYKMKFSGVYYTNPEDWINNTPGKNIPTVDNADWNAVEMDGAYPNVPNGYRLPTEAEWEYACRAGANPPTPWNTGADPITPDQANFANLLGTTKVGSYAPNAWGLYDMHGNVREWCLDRWNGLSSYGSESQTNPCAFSGSYRVARGGSSTFFFVENLRSAARTYSSPSHPALPVGLRVVRQ